MSDEATQNSQNDDAANGCFMFILLMLAGIGFLAYQAYDHYFHNSLDGFSVEHMDVEEVGFFKHFEDHWNTTANLSRELYEQSWKAATARSLGQSDVDTSAREGAATSYNDLRKQINEDRNSISSALPPDQFRKLHASWTKLCEVVGASDHVSSAVLDACAAFVRETRVLNDSISRGEWKGRSENSISLTFKPKILPVSLDKSGNWKIDFALPTPIGDISASQSGPEGIHRLIIKFDDKCRYFWLDRPFTVNAPAGYELIRVGSDSETLMVEVRHPGAGSQH